jgi:hypothetical protein
MLQQFIIITYLMAINGRWDDLREFFSVSREFLASNTRLSPEDQSKLNHLFEMAASLKAKEDAAQK